MLARGILGSGWTGSVSSRPFPNSSGWWWLISSVFLIRISCHKTTHANGYYGAWPGWAVSISVLPLTLPLGFVAGGGTCKHDVHPHVCSLFWADRGLLPPEASAQCIGGQRSDSNEPQFVHHAG